MNDRHWTDRLSEYLDDELSSGEREALEAHLSDCDECAATLAELRAVVTSAAALPELPPERDLWPGIAAKLPPRAAPAAAFPSRPDAAEDRSAGVLPFRRRLPRRVVLTVPQLVAAGIALALFSASGVWLALEARGGAAGPATAAVAEREPGSAAVPVVYSPAYQTVVTELEAEFDRRREALDPETIRVVERNLAIIDGAIREAQQALATDPSSAFLNSHLADAMRRKVDLLRQAARIERTEI